MRRNRFSWLVLGLALALATSTVMAQTQPQARRDAAHGTNLRGRVVRVDAANNQFMLRTTDGKEVAFYTTPEAIFRFNDRVVRFADLRDNMDVSVVYDTRDQRNYVSSVTTVTETAPAAPAAPTAPANAEVRGRISAVQSNPNHLILKTTDGKEMIVYLDDTRDITVRFEMRDGKRFLTGLSAAGVVENNRTTETVPAAPANGTTVEGTVIKVVGADNQFILRTPEGREVTFYSAPEAVYRFEDRDARFADLREGVPVTVTYDTRDKRNVVRSVFGRRRR